MTEISRREFIRLAGLVASGILESSCGHPISRLSLSIRTPTSTSSPRIELPTTASPSSTNQIKHAETSSPHSTDQVEIVITPDAQAFDNFLPVETDSLGGISFRVFIGNPNKLIDAWTVEGSIYSPWIKTETLASVKYAPYTFLPRWSERETISLTRLNTPQIIKTYGKDTTAFILDSGGAHSLAMAYELAKDGGWQPVPMLRGIPCKFENCATSGADQDVATALYPASEMLLVTQKLHKNAAPAFIWDAHRGSMAIGNAVDNSYRFSPSDLPDGDFLVGQGIKNIIYVTEADAPTPTPWIDEGYYGIDSFIILATYQRSGLDIFYLGISPNRNQKFP